MLPLYMRTVLIFICTVLYKKQSSILCDPVTDNLYLALLIGWSMSLSVGCYLKNFQKILEMDFVNVDMPGSAYMRLIKNADPAK